MILDITIYCDSYVKIEADSVTNIGLVRYFSNTLYFIMLWENVKNKIIVFIFVVIDEL